MTLSQLAAAYDSLHDEGTALAGDLGDLSQRANVYRHIFRASQGNHAFPLIAAHGALWAGGQFRFAVKLGRWLAWQYPLSFALRQARMIQLADFCNALRDINRRVCIDTYVQFHFTRRFSGHPEVACFVPEQLLPPLQMLHRACEQRQPLTDAQRPYVFEAHFRHEQNTIVGQRLEEAATALTWPLAKWFALRPRIKFAYLPPHARIAFRNFANQQERIRNGLQAFDFAAEVGRQHVEQSLSTYGTLDEATCDNPDGAFARTLRDVRRTSRAFAHQLCTPSTRLSTMSFNK